MIVDFHTHTFPEKIAAAAIAKMQSDCHAAAFAEGTKEALLYSMKMASVDFSVVLPVITNPSKTSSINRISIENNNEDGLIYFGGIHPDTEKFKQELKNLVSAGIKGIKIHPVYQGLNIDDIRYLRILYEAAQLGLIVVTHSGYDIGFPGIVHCSPQMILNAVNRVGAVKLVLAHMGGWRNWEQVYELSDNKNIYIDTAFSLGEITPLGDGYYSLEELKLLNEETFIKIIRLFGSNRILFGTDSPWDSQKKLIESINSLDLNLTEKANIFSKNALHLLEM